MPREAIRDLLADAPAIIMWTARLRSPAIRIAASASSSESHPSRRAARIVLFGDATSTFSRSPRRCWHVFQTASKV
jgi:hypothetical protein